MSDTPNLDKLRHLASVLTAMVNDPQPGLASWHFALSKVTKDIASFAPPEAAAIKAIEEHNAQCVSLCDNRKRCGWSGYREYMKCPECPTDWIIEWPPSSSQPQYGSQEK
jgi:hypothetical protein